MIRSVKIAHNDDVFRESLGIIVTDKKAITHVDNRLERLKEYTKKKQDRHAISYILPILTEHRCSKQEHDFYIYTTRNVHEDDCHDVE